MQHFIYKRDINTHLSVRNVAFAIITQQREQEWYCLTEVEVVWSGSIVVPQSQGVVGAITEEKGREEEGETREALA